MSKQVFVIVGASLAGAKAAEELRAQGFDGRLLLLGAEPERPYERPPLTKDYLRGESPRERAYVHQQGFYAEQQIELETGVSVTSIDPDAARISLGEERELSYDKLLLATGAEPRRIPIPGAELSGVYYLRTLEDCDLLRARMATSARVAVVGAGWIGSELAASTRMLGLEVTVIDPLALPLQRIFGAEIGAFYRDLHREHGVELILGDAVQSFEGADALQRVRTASGRAIECDFAVVAVGVAPRTELATAAGLEVDNGIIVSDALRTSAPDVFAAGDVANAWHPFLSRRIRVEHWANAGEQGAAAARAMLGQPTSYERLPYFFSDQYDVGMEYSGYATEWDEVVFRGERDSRQFIAFWLAGGRVLAGMNVNVWDVNEQIRALVRSREQVDKRALCDTQTPLESLIGTPAPRG